MSRRNTLPSSLELLLDTMCNTFGGIVFIAIALVIITQVTQKVLTETAELRGTPEAKQTLRDQNAQLEQEIAELRAELQERALVAAKCSPEKRAKIEALLQARIDLATAQARIDALAEEFSEFQEKKEALQTEVLDFQEQVKATEEQLQELEAERQLAQEAGEELKKQAEKLKKENRRLEKDLAESEAQNAFTVAFSMESATQNLQQCVALLRNGRLYVENVNLSWRETGNEVDAVFSGSGFPVTPPELGRAFSRVGRNACFVEIWADARSFDALVALRQWLREKQYRVSWHYADSFRFYRGGGSHNTSY